MRVVYSVSKVKLMYFIRTSSRIKAVRKCPSRLHFGTGRQEDKKPIRNEKQKLTLDLATPKVVLCAICRMFVELRFV